METAQEEFELLEKTDLLVNSGVYDYFVDGSKTIMSETGLPEFERPPRRMTPVDYERMLEVSAFSSRRLPEHELAHQLFAQEPEIREHPVVGFHLATYAGAVCDDTARASSSSGGLTTWVLKQLLTEGKVDGVLHMVAQTADGAPLFGYAISRTIDEIEAGAKTRYYPGHFGDQLAEATADGGVYAVVGIPSVLYELRLATRVDPQLADRFRYFIGLVCGHQKSARYAESLAWQVGVLPENLDSIDFRVKLEGRRSSEYGTEIVGRNSEGTPVHRVLTAAELYGTDWGLGFFKANFSDYTEDVFNETADIVFGDAWLPPYLEDSRGHNIVITRSPVLHEMLLRGLESGQLSLEQLEAKSIIRSQGGLVRHSRELVAARMEYFESLGEYVPELRFHTGERAPLLRKIVQKLRVRLARRSHHAFLTALQARDFEKFPKLMNGLTARYAALYRVFGFVASVKRRLP